MPIIAPDEAERRRYLDAKRDKMGHLLPSLGGARRRRRLDVSASLGLE